MLGARSSRGVVVFDPDTIKQDQLKEWDALGVRGVRVNMKSVSREVTKEGFQRELQRYAKMIPKNWVLQLYVELRTMPWLSEILPSLNCKVVVDHFGCPPSIPEDMSSLSGWSELINMLENNEGFFTKISAPYRYVPVEEYGKLESAVKELLRARRGEGVVFASDWPHTRFEGQNLKIGDWAGLCLKWCEELGEGEKRIEGLFRGNAQKLWDVQDRQ